MNGYRAYDPFARGTAPVGVRTVVGRDARRNRSFPCEMWYPAAAQHAGHDTSPHTQDSFLAPMRTTPQRQEAARDALPQAGAYPLVLFSHFSGGHRRASSFLCTHLASHGYVVAALDHSEVVAPELARRQGETSGQRHARTQAWIDSRVPGEQAHLFVRGLSVAHMDAALKGNQAARDLLVRNVRGTLARRGIDAIVYPAAQRSNA